MFLNEKYIIRYKKLQQNRAYKLCTSGFASLSCYSTNIINVKVCTFVCTFFVKIFVAQSSSNYWTDRAEISNRSPWNSWVTYRQIKDENIL